MMKSIPIIVFLVCCYHTSWGQLSLIPSYSNQQINVKQPHHSEFQVTKYNMVGGGLAYWFRLKKIRLEFHPEVYYQKDIQASVISWSAFGFSAHTQVYPFDFGNDCQCPTFSKQGQYLKKGFYLFITPGIRQLKYDQAGLEASGESDLGYVAGAGMGFDFGLGNVVTISPMIGYNYQFFNQNSLFNRVSSWNGGIRLFFRWDSENFYRRR